MILDSLLNHYDYVDGIPLPRGIECEVLQSVTVLLVSTNEFSIAWNYLEPLDGHKHVHKYNQGGQQTELITYYIGKYGICPAAVRRIPPVFQTNDNPTTIVMMADRCFPNLGAIISVGVACGIKRKVQILDVLVSSKVINYDYDITMKSYLPKGEEIIVPSPVVKLFTQPVKWPNDTIKEYLKSNRQRMPYVKSGVILSGPHVLDDPVINRLVTKLANEALGIEMDGANLFAENQLIAVNKITVKAVCDFGDGKNIKINQHTAALLAVDLVHNILSHPQAPEILKGLAT